MSRLNYSDLDEETKRKLRESFNIDGRGVDPISERVLAVGKVLKAIDNLTKKDSLWALNRVIEYILPQLSPSPDDRPQENSMEDVIRTTAKVYNLEYEYLVGKGRTAEVAEARQMAMYILSSGEQHSLAAVGLVMGGRSPATVSHAYNKVYTELERSLTKRNILKEIKIRLGIID